jgi:hypothetical protein
MTVELKFAGSGDFEAQVTKAQNLMHKAKVKASAEFNRFVQGGRDLLGDRPNLQEAIRVWGLTAGHVTHAEGSLLATKEGLGYWTGDTANSVRTWIGDVKTQSIFFWKTTLGGNGGASGAIVSSLQGASDAVGQFMNGLYDALVTLVSGLLDAVGTGVAGLLKKIDPGAIVSAATKALVAFVAMCGKLFSTAITALNSMDKSGNDIFVAGAVLPEVREPSNAVVDLGMKPNLAVG